MNFRTYVSFISRPKDSSIASRVQAHKDNQLKVGSAFPNSPLTKYKDREMTQAHRVNFSTHDVLIGKRVALFTVPGAWTPTCTKSHLAGFKENAAKILGLEIDKIICLTPDKVDTTHEWNLAKGDFEKIEMWADDTGKITDAIGLGLDMSGDRAQGMGLRRSVMVINNLFVEMIEIEKEAGNCQLSHAKNLIAYLSKPL